MNLKLKTVIQDKEELRERFETKYNKKFDDQCWNWVAGKSGNGYGMIKIAGKNRLAHRVSYLLYKSEDLDNNVLHTCDNRACVNPNHLYLGDQKDNLRDAVERGRLDFQGEKNKRAKLTKEDVKEVRKMLDNGMTQREVGDNFGVSRGCIADIDQGRSWSHVDD
jgi:DNA-binding XRE family transcriptional regulator